MGIPVTKTIQKGSHSTQEYLHKTTQLRQRYLATPIQCKIKVSLYNYDLQGYIMTCCHRNMSWQHLILMRDSQCGYIDTHVAYLCRGTAALRGAHRAHGQSPLCPWDTRKYDATT